MGISEFRVCYENHHMPLYLKSASGMKRYMRCYFDSQLNAETGFNEELEWDVITELWFDMRLFFKGTVRYLSSTVMSVRT